MNHGVTLFHFRLVGTNRAQWRGRSFFISTNKFQRIPELVTISNYLESKFDRVRRTPSNSFSASLMHDETKFHRSFSLLAQNIISFSILTTPQIPEPPTLLHEFLIPRGRTYVHLPLNILQPCIRL